MSQYTPIHCLIIIGITKSSFINLQLATEERTSSFLRPDNITKPLSIRAKFPTPQLLDNQSWRLIVDVHLNI